ncbi:MAG: translation elongation factor-like protein [Candidatus Omnitrophota bacterium]
MIFAFLKKKKPKSAASAKEQVKIEGKALGTIVHYFSHCKAGVLKLKGPLSAGDTIRIVGHTTDFKQKVTSMQVDGKPMTSAKKGDEIGLLVKKRVRIHDTVYEVS